MARSIYLIDDLFALAQDLEELKPKQSETLLVNDPQDVVQTPLAALTPDKQNETRVSAYVSNTIQWITTREKMLQDQQNSQHFFMDKVEIN